MGEDQSRAASEGFAGFPLPILYLKRPFGGEENNLKSGLLAPTPSCYLHMTPLEKSKKIKYGDAGV